MRLELKLTSLEGQGECALVLESHSNGDIYVELTGQDTTGNFGTIRAQSLSPRGGGCKDIEVYEKLSEILRKHGR